MIDCKSWFYRRIPSSLEPKKEMIWHRVVLASAGAVLFIFVIAGFAPYFLSVSTSQTPNEFGDSFGFVNALFAGMAFTGVIITLFMQMTELRMQRQELEDQRKAIEESTDAQRQMAELYFVSAYANCVVALNGTINNQGEKSAELYNTVTHDLRAIVNLGRDEFLRKIYRTSSTFELFRFLHHLIQLLADGFKEFADASAFIAHVNQFIKVTEVLERRKDNSNVGLVLIIKGKVLDAMGGIGYENNASRVKILREALSLTAKAMDEILRPPPF